MTKILTSQTPYWSFYSDLSLVLFDPFPGAQHVLYCAEAEKFSDWITIFKGFQRLLSTHPDGAPTPHTTVREAKYHVFKRERRKLKGFFSSLIYASLMCLVPSASQNTIMRAMHSGHYCAPHLPNRFN